METSVRPADPRNVKPVTVISRLSSVPAVSVAARIITSGTETIGARPDGNGNASGGCS